MESCISLYTYFLQPQARWTGKQIFSTLLPRDLTLHSRAHVVVDQGELLAGEVTKKVVGRSAGAGSIAHVLARRGALPEFIGAAQRLAHAYLLLRGFSTGVGDCVLPEAVRADIDDMRELITNPSDLDRVRDRVGAAVHASLSERHGMKNMADAGSKGSVVNMCQIAGLVGQQHVSSGACGRGRVPPRAYGVAALPHFHRGDWGPAAGGFCGRSYLQGLTPHGFWHHAMAGREGIIVRLILLQHVARGTLARASPTPGRVFPRIPAPYCTNCREWHARCP